MTDAPRNVTTLMRARISRRHVLAAGAAAAGASALALAGCRSTHDAPKPAPTQTPKRGGTLRIGTALPLSYGLDPHAERGTGLAICPRIYGYPHHVDLDDVVQMDHAEQIEQPDALTYVFTLRGDVKFQDVAPASGRAVNAADVAASIVRFRDHTLVADNAWHRTVLDRVEIMDPRRLRVVLRRPSVYALRNLGDIAAGAILPVEAIESQANLRIGTAGSGPFSVQVADSAARRWRIVRNGGYFRGGIPYLDAMEWRVFDDDDAKLAAFERRELDQVDNRDRSEAQAAQAADAGVDVDAFPSLAWLSLGLRIDAPPFSDARVREAIDIAIDRDELIRNIAPGTGKVLGPVNPHLAGGFWSLSEDDVRHGLETELSIDDRRERAGLLLAAAGAAGASFSMSVPALPRLIDVATAVREQLSRVGLDVRVNEQDQLAWYFDFRRGAFATTLISQPPYESPEMPARLFHSRGIDGNGNSFGLREPGLDALIERSEQEADRDARRALLLNAQVLMMGTRSMLQLFTSAGYDSAWKYVRNRRAELIGSAAQYNYEQWLDV